MRSTNDDHGLQQLCVGNGRQQDIDSLHCEILTHLPLCDWLVAHQGHCHITTGGTAQTHQETSEKHVLQRWTDPARYATHNAQRF